MSDRAWHCVKTNPSGTPEKSGPYGEEDFFAMIAAGDVRHSTLVWTPGMAEWKPSRDLPELAERLPKAPPTSPHQVPYSAPSRKAGNPLIPSKNSAALLGYYVSIFALIPALGLLLGMLAVYLGIRGLAAHRKDPTISGKAHAWVAIVLGSLVLVGHLVVFVLLASR